MKQAKDMQECGVSRRRFISYFSGLGLSATLLPGALWAKFQEAQAQRISKSMLMNAEKLAGLEFTDDEREMMVRGVNGYLRSYEEMRKLPLDNGVAPAIQFNPIPQGQFFKTKKEPFRITRVKLGRIPYSIEDLAFWPVTHLSYLIRARKITSLELTRMYLNRLKKYDPVLKCVITLTEELAFAQAKRADDELRIGNYRGPLHGIPWGAKDLLATRDYRTTWGAMPYKDQVLDYDATVVERLNEAGAVLIAKLSMGALAMGDVWYGGRTRNPWNTEQGSSGSSAGPAAATAAGLVGFSIGTETLGSIVSPCSRCGVTGLRPTFGRISRHGAMALSWSMDKIGPMCRSAEDCALVFDAIYGPDNKDTTVVDLPFNYNAYRDITRLRIGYTKSAFERERRDADARKRDNAVLDVLRSLGVTLIPVELPEYPLNAIRFVLNTEASAAFDELTRSNNDELLVRQNSGAWPNSFRQARMIPAVEYLQANRHRRKVMDAMAAFMEEIDVYLVPSSGTNNLLLTNLTGHPTVVLPNGFRENGTPTSITFTGRLFGEAELLLVAKAYQDATDFHRQHPNLEQNK